MAAPRMIPRQNATVTNTHAIIGSTSHLMRRRNRVGEIPHPYFFTGWLAPHCGQTHLVPSPLLVIGVPSFGQAGWLAWLVIA